MLGAVTVDRFDPAKKMNEGLTSNVPGHFFYYSRGRPVPRNPGNEEQSRARFTLGAFPTLRRKREPSEEESKIFLFLPYSIITGAPKDA